MPTDNGKPGHVVATLGYDNTAVTVEASGIMPTGFPFSTGLRVVGQLEALEVTTKFVEEPPETTFMSYASDGIATEVAIEGHDPYEAEFRYFVDCVLGKADPGLLDAERAVDALRLSIATQQSLRDSKRVVLRQ